MLLKPKGQLGELVQGIWSLNTAHHPQAQLSKWLHADACSGVIFNLGEAFQLSQYTLRQGATFLPVSKRANQLKLPQNCHLAGIRFREGVSTVLFGETFAKPTPIEDTQLDMQLNALGLALQASLNNYAQVRLIYQWLINEIGFNQKLPANFVATLEILRQQNSIEELTQHINLSQRQIERQYRKWLDMTPAQYQRLMRVKNTLNSLRSNPNIELATLALDNGYSDQSHMTREFKALAATTPLKYLKQFAKQPVK